MTSGGPIRAVEARMDGVDQMTARRTLRTVANCSLVNVVVRDRTFARAGSG